MTTISEAELADGWDDLDHLDDVRVTDEALAEDLARITADTPAKPETTKTPRRQRRPHPPKIPVEAIKARAPQEILMPTEVIRALADWIDRHIRVMRQTPAGAPVELHAIYQHLRRRLSDAGQNRCGILEYGPHRVGTADAAAILDVNPRWVTRHADDILGGTQTRPGAPWIFDRADIELVAAEMRRHRKK